MVIDRIRKYPAFIRWGSWEYWPMWLTNIPVITFWFINACIARSLTFFTAANPALYMGGLFGTSKEKINQLIPSEYLPRTLYTEPSEREFEEILNDLEANSIHFPMIIKPDIGERGLNVQRVDTPEQLRRAMERCKHKVIIQEFIDYPLEFSILCYKMPGTERGGITSVCAKEFLKVTGDGKSTIRQLMEANDRAILQFERLADTVDLDRILDEQETLVLEHIGNHSRGTKFMDAGDMICRTMEDAYLAILDRMTGAYFGRFDLKARSVDDFINAQDIRILEFNGVNSEPVHIYDPGYSIWRAYRDLWKHWTIIRRIATMELRNGSRPAPVGTSWKAMWAYFDYQRDLKSAKS